VQGNVKLRFFKSQGDQQFSKQESGSPSKMVAQQEHDAMKKRWQIIEGPEP